MTNLDKLFELRKRSRESNDETEALERELIAEYGLTEEVIDEVIGESLLRDSLPSDWLCSDAYDEWVQCATGFVANGSLVPKKS